MDWAAFKPLGRWEKIGVGLFVLLFVVFGGLVEQKSAFLTCRMGDLDVSLRAAWAAAMMPIFTPSPATTTGIISIRRCTRS